MAANKKNLTQPEKDAIEAKKDALVETWQGQINGIDNITLGKVFQWVLLQMEEQGFEKKK